MPSRVDVHLFRLKGRLQPPRVRRYLVAGDFSHEFTQHAGIGGEILTAIDLAHLKLFQYGIEHIRGVDEKPRLVISGFDHDSSAVENRIQIIQIEDLETLEIAMQGD